MLIESSLPRDLNQLAEKGDFEFLVCSKVTIISICHKVESFSLFFPIKIASLGTFPFYQNSVAHTQRPRSTISPPKNLSSQS